MKLRALSLIAAAAVAAGALAACSSPAPSGSAPAKAATTAKAATAAKAATTAAAPAASNGRQDTFILAQGADPRGLDPAYVDDGESANVMVNVYEGLVQYGEKDTSLQPCLAESWTISDDGLVYVFKLKQGVKFHDGEDFNADAVKKSIDRQLPPNDRSEMPYADFTFGYIDKVEVVDPYTVKITLKQPSTPFLANLAMSLAAPIVAPKAIDDKTAMESPVGTGPYKFVSWEKGASVKLVANDSYWGGAPKIKNLIFQIIPDNAARASAMMAGDIDGMAQVDPASVQALKDKGIPIYEAPGMNINYMAFDVTRPPFDNPKLREAVIRAINVPELVQQLYLGYSIPAYSILPSFIPGYAKDVKNYDYDPEKAKSLLQEAGATNLNIKMIAYSNPRPYNTATGVKLAEAIQGYLSKVGVTCDITQYDWTTYKKMAQQGEGDIKFYGWTGDNGDADNFMNLLSVEDRSMNVSGYKNPAYTDLINKAAATPNGDARNALYAEMEKIIATDAPWLPISHSIVLVPYASGVVNFSQHPTGSTFFKYVSK